MTGHLPAVVALSKALATGPSEDIAQAEVLLRAIRAEHGDRESALDEVRRICGRGRWPSPRPSSTIR